ncbi:2-iminobutanoate/2-iminopropanoate deaminase [Microbacterium sp. W4I4]|uniref:Rid family detoxifying hydrolase n=1 Tax=Microbacterium sp. W4I4 TaxID=3042295 RepID=UPI00277E1805|nr:Rid family detoxifying hydrolase [Microbacterium sp. W4I4]MDQ0613828.1 2-iminobutanoate/2-iminopropanoate deaminase [Microbacterium sp. W4I4]
MFSFASRPRTTALSVAGVVVVTGLAVTSAIGGSAHAGSPAQPDRGSSAKKVLESPDAPAAIGPYSQGIAAGGTVYVSGQLPIDPRVGAIDNGQTIAEQTALSVQNIEAVLKEAKLDLGDVVSATVYLADMADFAEFNVVYAEYFGTEAAPARATVEVAELPLGAKVEISAIAVR